MLITPGDNGLPVDSTGLAGKSTVALIDIFLAENPSGEPGVVGAPIGPSSSPVLQDILSHCA